MVIIFARPDACSDGWRCDCIFLTTIILIKNTDLTITAHLLESLSHNTHFIQILDVEWRANVSSLQHTVPQVAECVQHLDLSWLPALFLIIFCPLPLYDLYRSEHARARCHSPITYRIVSHFSEDKHQR